MEKIEVFIHLISVIIGFGAVIVIDIFGLLWLLKRKTLSEVLSLANITQKLIWLGWFGAIISGFWIIDWHWPRSVTLQSKLYLVLLLGINGIWLHLLKNRLTLIAKQSKQVISLETKIVMTITTIISQIGWWSVILIGFWLTHLRPK